MSFGFYFDRVVILANERSGLNIMQMITLPTASKPIISNMHRIIKRYNFDFLFALKIFNYSAITFLRAELDSENGHHLKLS